MLTRVVVAESGDPEALLDVGRAFDGDGVVQVGAVLLSLDPLQTALVVYRAHLQKITVLNYIGLKEITLNRWCRFSSIMADIGNSINHDLDNATLKSD